MKRILFSLVVLTLLNLSLQAQNVLTTAGANPDFEGYDSGSDNVYWWYRQTDAPAVSTMTSVTTNPHGGARCFQANVTTVDGSAWHVQTINTKQFYPFVAGTSYTLRYWAKADAAGKSINGGLQNESYSDANVSIISGSMYGVGVTTSWAQYTLTFTVFANGNLRPFFHFGGATGVYNLDDVELGTTASIIPVELLSFKAQENNKNKTIALDWQVAQELRLKDYTVERSTDSKTFVNIGVRTAKNTPLSINYSFEDENPAQGVNYYRLKINEEDGSFKYSKVQSVKIGGKSDVSISPNPTTGLIQLKNADTFETVEVFNLNGQLIRTFSKTQKLDVSDLAKGVYQVRIKANDGVSVSQLVKM